MTVKALLGPTNTGKTHRAIERMLEHPTGMMGLPLRLLAREVYDRVSARCGEAAVALVTGEEKRIPRRPRYWVSTVEAMPLEVEVDFLAVDEIQLAAHPERGHVFTNRLLHARGRQETWFLGAETMREVLLELVPAGVIDKSPRLSTLTSTGASSLSALPKRSAVVAFSLPRVFELAQLLRKKRGGAAVVVGALSPRARNAQVAMYQAGDVDFLVATDAIGMGLNLDIDHVAFADLRKFDGREARGLSAAELAQIAGRAGRYVKNGSFGTLSPLSALPPELVRDLETHQFSPVRRLFYRHAPLDFESIESLRSSLRQRPHSSRLMRAEIALDQLTFEAVLEKPSVRRLVTARGALELLWTVSALPDYRQLLFEDHVALVERLFVSLSERGAVDAAWVDREIERLRAPAHDPETLMAHIAAVRTWNYVAHQKGWLERADQISERARALEDELSDALHQALVARYVAHASGRVSAAVPPAARSKPRGDAPAPVASSPFAVLASRMTLASSVESPTRAVEEMLEAPFSAFSAEAGGIIRYGDQKLGRLVRGRDLLEPEVAVSWEGDGGTKLRLSRRLVAWSRDLVSMVVGGFRDLPDLSPAGRGLAHGLGRGLGTVLVRDVADQLVALTDADKSSFERAGVHVGRVVVHQGEPDKRDRHRLRVALVSAFEGEPQPFPSGDERALPIGTRPAALWLALGFVVVGPRAIRADVLERVVGRVTEHHQTQPQEPVTERLASWFGLKAKDVPLVERALRELSPSAFSPKG